MNPPLHDAWEVVHEGQRYKGDISMETVFGKCNVLTCEVDEVPKSIGKQKRTWTFFCRFALAPRNTREFVPINQAKDLWDAAAKDTVAATSTSKSKAAEVATPSRVGTRSRKNSENEEIDAGATSATTTPRSSKRNRQPPKYLLDDTLPSPLKNSTFSVSSTKTKELCIVIQRCATPSSVNIKKEKVSPPEPSDHSVRVKARKRLDLEDTPTKKEVWIPKSTVPWPKKLIHFLQCDGVD